MKSFPVLWSWQECGTIERWYIQRMGSEVHQEQILAVCLVNDKRLELESPVDGILSSVAKSTNKVFKPGEELCQIVQCPHSTHYAGEFCVS
jgi:hypothetical protein